MSSPTIIATVAPPVGIHAAKDCKVAPALAAALADLVARAADHRLRVPITLAHGQIPQQVWRIEHHRYADWLDAGCPQVGRSTAWSPRMSSTHVPAWGDDLAHGGWAAAIDFATMLPRRASGEVWVEQLADWVGSFWLELLNDVGLHLVSATPHTTGFGRIVPGHLSDADRPTVRALNGVTGAFGGGQDGARALALSWLALDGLPVIDPRELTPDLAVRLDALRVDMAAPPSVLLNAPAVLKAIGRHRDRLNGNRESYDGEG